MSEVDRAKTGQGPKRFKKDYKRPKFIDWLSLPS
jgi:hypothetical protein